MENTEFSLGNRQDMKEVLQTVQKTDRYVGIFIEDLKSDLHNLFSEMVLVQAFAHEYIQLEMGDRQAVSVVQSVLSPWIMMIKGLSQKLTSTEGLADEDWSIFRDAIEGANACVALLRDSLLHSRH